MTQAVPLGYIRRCQFWPYLQLCVVKDVMKNSSQPRVYFPFRHVTVLVHGSRTPPPTVAMMAPIANQISVCLAVFRCRDRTTEFISTIPRECYGHLALRLGHTS